MQTRQVLENNTDVCFIARLVRMGRTLYGKIPTQDRPFHGLKAGDDVEVTLLSYKKNNLFIDMWYRYNTKLVEYRGLLYFSIPEDAVYLYGLKPRDRIRTSIVARLVKKQNPRNVSDVSFSTSCLTTFPRIMC